MDHELTLKNTTDPDVWMDFGYSSEKLLTASRAIGVGMIKRMDRTDVETKTQAFAKTLEEEGEKVGIPLDTPTDYFILGAAFASSMQALGMAELHMRKAKFALPLILGIGVSAGLAVAKLVIGDANWIGYAAMAVLLLALKRQLAQPSVK